MSERLQRTSVKEGVFIREYVDRGEAIDNYVCPRCAGTLANDDQVPGVNGELYCPTCDMPWNDPDLQKWTIEPACYSAEPCPGCGERVQLFTPGFNIVLTPDAIWHEKCRKAAL